MSVPEFYVYRFYDRSGTLLYVGSTNHLLRRIGEHKRRREWWKEVGRIDFIDYETENAARLAEWTLIMMLRPVYNKMYTEKING